MDFFQNHMDLLKQQLFVAAPSSNEVTISSFDTATWSALNQWKSSSVSRGTLNVLHKWRSVIGSNESKPMMHVWNGEVAGSRHPETKTIMPGNINALIVSPDENYLVGAIKVSFWTNFSHGNSEGIQMSIIYFL